MNPVIGKRTPCRLVGVVVVCSVLGTCVAVGLGLSVLPVLPSALIGVVIAESFVIWYQAVGWMADAKVSQQEMPAFTPVKKDCDDSSAVGFQHLAGCCDEGESSLRRSSSSSVAPASHLAQTAHDIRTAVAGIVNVVPMLRDPRHEASRTQHIDIVDDCASFIALLVGDMVDGEKLANGKMTVELTTLNVCTEVCEALKVTAASARVKRIDLSFYAKEDIPSVVADSTYLRRAVVNIVHNAVKFTPELGYVSVRCEKSVDSTAVEICVSDSGIGISAEEAGSIFRPFTQCSNNTQGRSTGAGIGLSSVKGMMKLMKGDIMFESELGKGSTFRLCVPVARDSLVAATAPSPLSLNPRLNIAILFHPLGRANTIRADVNPNTTEWVVMRLLQGHNVIRPTSLSELHSITDRVDCVIRTECDGGDPAMLEWVNRCHRVVTFSTAISTQSRDALICPVLPSDLEGLLQCRSVAHPGDVGRCVGRRKKVLYIDDSDTLRMVMEKQLQDHGFEVVCAGGGVQGVAMFESLCGLIDIVILDLEMPDLAGGEVARLIRAYETSNGLGRVPVIAVSGKDSFNVKLERNFDDFLGKPTSGSDLVRKIKQHLDDDDGLNSHSLSSPLLSVK